MKTHGHEMRVSEPKPLTGKAAFFDIDGTLISTNVVHAYGYYAMNEGSVLDSMVEYVRDWGAHYGLVESAGAASSLDCRFRQQY